MPCSCTGRGRCACSDPPPPPFGPGALMRVGPQGSDPTGLPPTSHHDVEPALPPTNPTDANPLRGPPTMPAPPGPPTEIQPVPNADLTGTWRPIDNVPERPGSSSVDLIGPPRPDLVPGHGLGLPEGYPNVPEPPPLDWFGRPWSHASFGEWLRQHPELLPNQYEPPSGGGTYHERPPPLPPERPYAPDEVPSGGPFPKNGYLPPGYDSNHPLGPDYEHLRPESNPPPEGQPTPPPAYRPPNQRPGSPGSDVLGDVPVRPPAPRPRPPARPPRPGAGDPGSGGHGGAGMGPFIFLWGAELGCKHWVQSHARDVCAIAGQLNSLANQANALANSCAQAMANAPNAQCRDDLYGLGLDAQQFADVQAYDAQNMQDLCDKLNAIDCDSPADVAWIASASAQVNVWIRFYREFLPQRGNQLHQLQQRGKPLAKRCGLRHGRPDLQAYAVLD